MSEIQTVGIVGTGAISSGWAARFLAHGLQVVVSDSNSEAEEQLRADVDRAWPALQKLGLMPGADRARLRFTADLEELCRMANFIQQTTADWEEVGRKLYREMDRYTSSEVVIASSSSLFLPTRIQEECRYPGRIIVAHPSYPVYLMPLVEILGGEKTHESSIKKAISFYRRVGMHPLLVRKEREGLIADRLQAALWREALFLVEDGTVTFREIDDAVSYGPGLSWAIMGPCLTLRLTGEIVLENAPGQLGPASRHEWVQRLTRELPNCPRDHPVSAKQPAGGPDIDELERVRDDCLISIMRGLRQYNQASGKIIAMLDAKRYTSYEHSHWTHGSEVDKPLRLYNCPVDPNWIDYNGHMTEASYLVAFGDASDALFRYVGIEEDYRARGHSLYTVETHLNYYSEVGSGDPLIFTTQLLGLDEKRLHLFHSMYHSISDKLIATTEQMLVHVDVQASAASLIEPNVYKALSVVMEAHKDMPVPRQVGRQMVIRIRK